MFDAGRHHRAKIGFVLLATEQTIEDDMFTLRPNGVGVHFSRAWIEDSITVESLSRHADGLAEAARMLLPDGSLDVISYGCTSGSLVIGEERVAAELAKGATGAKPTSLIAAVIAALQAVGARRVAVVTPYLDEINRQEKAYLERAGFEIPRIEGLQLEKDSDMIRVRPDHIADVAAEVDGPDNDALFISCGALRSLDIVDGLERRLGKPVICSNQAMMWHALRLAGVTDRRTGFGRLFREH